MGHLEAQERYRQGKTLTDQTVEDLVARRVLRGLGLVQKHLPAVEKIIFGEADYDEAIWPRTLKLMKHAFHVEGHAYYIERHVFECYEASGKHNDILERLNMVPPGELELPVFMTRIKNTQTSVTYSTWKPAVLDLVTPFSAIAEIGKNTENHVYVIVQETEHYVKQFMTNGYFLPAVERALNV